MMYKAQLIYFRQTGKFLAMAETTIAGATIVEIWEEIDNLRRLGCLPGLRPGSGRDLFVLVDVPDHPQRELHLVMTPFLDEDDVTPARTSTGAMAPLVRVPLAEILRTAAYNVVTFDVTDVAEDADTGGATEEKATPIEVPTPLPLDKTDR